MTKYTLINPIITGTLKTSFSTDTPLEGAKAFWEEFTVNNKILLNELNKFYFTLEDEEKNHYHFLAREKDDGKNVTYDIQEANPDVSHADEKKFDEFVNDAKKEETKIKGGKHRYRRVLSDSSSDSDSDTYFPLISNVSLPVTYFQYYPMIYKVKDFYSPVFIKPISPYVKIYTGF